MMKPYSSPELIDACCAFTSMQEAPDGKSIPFLYLDIASNVTVGLGTMLPDVMAAVQAFELTEQSGVDLMIREFAAVQRSSPGHLSAFYENLTTIRLPDARAKKLLAVKLSDAISVCVRRVPNFVSLSGPAQVAVVDIQYNVRGGVLTFPGMLACLRENDLEGAAQQSYRPQLPSRSTATAALIRSGIKSDS